MTDFEKSLRSSLSEMQGHTPYDHEEIVTLRRRAWTEQGILIISVSNNRLSKRDKTELIRMAELIYGKKGEGA